MNQGRKKRLVKKIFMEAFPGQNKMNPWKFSRGSNVDFFAVASCLSNTKISVSSENVLHN